MKNLLIINSLALTFISFNANAGLFGVSNYEECMSDGKVGRTNSEIQLLKNSCEIKFPHLKHVNLGTSAHLVCIGKDENNLQLKINKSQVLSGKDFNNTSPIKFRQSNTLYFNLNKIIRYKQDFLFTNVELNTLNGQMKWELRETEQGSVLDTFYLTCDEKSN